jgi:hypothetical protein
VDSCEIRKVRQSEEARAVAVQVMAFGADPVMRWLYPEPDEYLTHFPRFVRAFGGRAFESCSGTVSSPATERG